ncbi:MAG: DEAD/DEAH box helicase [Panacagrimonas sp.]
MSTGGPLDLFDLLPFDEAAERRPPAEPGPPHEQRIVPRPWLRLYTHRISTWFRGRPERRPIGAARLTFEYAGHRLAPAASRARRGVGPDAEPFRNRSAELDALERLSELHVTDATEVEGVYFASDPVLKAGDFVLERGRGVLATPDHWLHLLPRLSAAGFRLEFSPEFPVELLSAPNDWRAEITPRSQGKWFDLGLALDVDGARIELLPILRSLLADPNFPREPAPNEPSDAVWLAPLDSRRHVPLPLERLRRMLGVLESWIRSQPVGDRLRVKRAQADLLDDFEAIPELSWRGRERLAAERGRLHDLAHGARRSREPAPGFRAELRAYQKEGLAWLGFLGEAGLGGVLADDMGLGKTVQVLAHIWTERVEGRLDKPVLVVAPTTLVANWRDETHRFAPELRVLILHGPDREARFARIADCDIAISTYPLLARDRNELRKHAFGLLVLDESQTIKNARTLAARAVRELKADRRLAMTGTPLENHLGELWAQFDAVEPGLLGDEAQFNRLVRQPIEEDADATALARLNRRVAPLMLRRRKEDVLHDLPPKTEIVQAVQLEPAQADLYEAIRLAQHQRVREAVRHNGGAQSGIVVLDALLRLRQVCCDPRLVKLEGVDRDAPSAKLERLLELVDGLLLANRRVLVFSQFTEMLELIRAQLAERGIAHLLLTGQTQDRAEVVARFQNLQAPVFLISLKAGGVGLNLTAADTVIHYDPWWNPAAEDQATDRAHRIGQSKPVFVYKLICAGTVEERIRALQARKAELARAVLEGGTSATLRFDDSDIDELFAPLGR